jgi:DNA polymerase|nr:MAG TPA: DNA polymerase I [Caudoviricetes sp.]
MHSLGIDIETFSSREIKDVGVYAYTDAPDFTVLLFAYAMDDDEVKIIDLANGEKLPAEILRALFSPEVKKTAYNANFEMTCLSKFLGRPMLKEQWFCTSVLALTLGLPGYLAGVAEAMNFSEDKQKMTEGKRLISYFCKPCAPTKSNGGRDRNLPEHAPEKWDLFKQYCKQDVIVEQEILKKLSRYTPSEKEHRLWMLDQKINDTGILIDTQLASAAIHCDYTVRAEAIQALRKLTGLENPNSVAQLKAWLENAMEEKIDSLNKQWVLDALQRENMPNQIRTVLQLKTRIAKTSVKKYKTMLDAKCADNRIRGLLQFYGANRTGRWAGRIVQVHNLPQNHIEALDYARDLVKDDNPELLQLICDNPSDILSQLIRTALIASPGKELLVADFSAIEARVIAWLAQERWRLDVFRKNGDIYCASASTMFNVPVEKHGVNGHLRQKGKIAELALGYQGSVGALIQMGALRMGVPEEELPEIVAKWRQASPHIVKFWYDVERCVRQAIQHRISVPFRYGIAFIYEAGMLFIRLPSGRRIAYAKPRLVQKDGKNAITFLGVNQTSKAWCRQETYGGKLVENIVQATARDCLAEAMLRLDAAGYRILMHVHDEVIIEAEKGKADLNKVIRIMSENEPWNRGLPLNADGYKTDYYRKD